ncbi:hypothetical protein Sjap_005257 [Stephania japonica]|uniref:START domain-containing protein n=1 Tax=Stephania japonica TaxID=461633 RepID=A0AAP0K568_9MAGN
MQMFMDSQIELKKLKRAAKYSSRSDDVDYMADDNEMADIVDEMEEEFHGRGIGESESDDDEYDHLNTKITDTSFAQVRRGKDIQGIPWDRLSSTREKYRQTRLEQYKNYENILQSGEGSEKNRWAEMFPCMIARTSTTDVISIGVDGTRNAALKLMRAELQVLSPLVPIREVNFLQFCKQHAEGVWAVVDVSIDADQDASNPSNFLTSRRLPSGCVVQDMPNGYSKKAMAEALERILTPQRSIYILRDVHAAKEQGRPYLIVFVGVNGVGKSTNLAKVNIALIDMYAKCGSLEDAISTFENMRFKDTLAWSTMIVACAIHGQSPKAISVFKNMNAA